jgi:hypothetical protein
LSLASSLLTALLAFAPFTAVANPAFAEHAIFVFAAMLALLSAVFGAPTEFAAGAQLLRHLALSILFPALWIVFQTVPLPSASLANPIWSTASAALNESLTARISIDPGATSRCLAWYVGLLSIVLSTVVIAKDRQRAKTVLIGLTAVTTFMAIEFLLTRFDLLEELVPGGSASKGSAFAAAAILATISNGALIWMTIERRLTSAKIKKSLWPTLFKILCGIVGIALGLIAIRGLAQIRLFAFVGIGFVVLLFIAIARRSNLPPLPSAIAATILIAVVSAIALPVILNGSPFSLLALAHSTDPAGITVAQHNALSQMRPGKESASEHLGRSQKSTVNSGTSAPMRPPPLW